MKDPTELFVYGTLKHDEPEHARFCRGVLNWRRARMRGQLVRLREGWLLTVVSLRAMLGEASADARADEARRASMDLPDSTADTCSWVDGEVLRFADAEAAWPPLDAWEGYEPGAGGIYRRCIVSAEVMNEPNGWVSTLVWAYVAGEVPDGATAL